MLDTLTAAVTLPEDGTAGALVGRVMRPGLGPSVVTLRENRVIDITAAFATVSILTETADPAAALAAAEGEDIGSIDEILWNSFEPARNEARPWFLAPVDLHAVKAAGVTFAVSMVERVIEEQAKGAPDRAASIRAEIEETLGGQVAGLVPGSPQATALKQLLIAKGAWSQYLEVGIGPDAEIFTKCPVLAAVGTGAYAGLHPTSVWNNPEPEMVLVVASSGRIVGATLGNDVNLRDVEGRSALLLGRAKDNNASATLGPFIRLIDDTFTLDDIRKADVTLRVEGTDGFVLDGVSSMTRISRDPEDLARQLVNRNHQYPDGAVLYCGTMFAPVKDRDGPGQGFTHHDGDVVTIASARLGRLVNVMTRSNEAPPWTFGLSALMKNLAGRGVL